MPISAKLFLCALFSLFVFEELLAVKLDLVSNQKDNIVKQFEGKELSSEQLQKLELKEKRIYKKLKRRQEKKKSDISGVFSFLFGLAGLIPFIGIVFSLMSILIGIKAIKKRKNTNVKTVILVFAFLGIVLGILGFGIHFFYFMKTM